MNASDSAIRAHGLYKRFKTGRVHTEVLKRVDFDARHGEVTMVMGPSGSGKSTLVATLSGLLKPDEGQVSAMGQDLWSLKPGKLDRFRLDHCGFIFQGFNLFSSLTALLTVGVYILAVNGGVPMGFPLSWQINVAIFLLITAVVSGFVALGVLKKSQPADLLR